MARRLCFAILAFTVLGGVAAAQSQVRLDPGVDGQIRTSSGTVFSYRQFFYAPSTINVTNYSYFYGSSYNSWSYVMKFDVSGINEVLDARLIVYFPRNSGYPSYLFWQNGGNESNSPSAVNSSDLPTGPRHYPDGIFGFSGGPNGGIYSGASWDITDEIRADLSGGHSDYVIGIGSGYGGYGYGGGLNQRVFTTHPFQGTGAPNGRPDQQGSLFGPYILYTPGVIPEPGTLALLGLGLVSLGVAYRRRRRKAA